MVRKLARFLKGSKGTTAIEYALIASLIAVVAITAMKMIGGSISNKFNEIGEAISEAGSESGGGSGTGTGG